MEDRDRPLVDGGVARALEVQVVDRLPARPHQMSAGKRLGFELGGGMRKGIRRSTSFRVWLAWVGGWPGERGAALPDQPFDSKGCVGKPLRRCGELRTVSSVCAVSVMLTTESSFILI